MLTLFEQTLRENNLVAAGDRVLVAFSGGADSMALLYLLQKLSKTFPYEVAAAHLDHQLRPESQDDAAFAREACARLGVPLMVGQADVRGVAAAMGAGLEAAGREERYRFLQRVADDQACSVIALGHHADDQAETILFRIARGTGLSGLSAMQMKSPPYIRPLLKLRSEEIRAFLQQEGVAWREDVSNSDLRFSRNRVRHEVLPQLEQINPRLVDALTRLGRHAAEENVFWNRYTEAFLEEHGAVSPDGFDLGVTALADLGSAERRRVLRAFLGQVNGYLSAIESIHIDQVENLLTAEKPQGELSLPGIWVGRRYDRLVCAAAAPEIPDYDLEIVGPGDYLLPAGGTLRISIGEDLEKEDASELFSAADVRFPLHVRPPRDGDRFQPSGMTGTKRLKDYFIDAKVDREIRLRTPVVCCGSDIILLAGRRRSERFRPAPGEKQLKITFLKPEQVVE